MQEEHIVAAILTAGTLARSSEDRSTADVIALYNETLGAYLESIRPARGAQQPKIATPKNAVPAGNPVT